MSTASAVTGSDAGMIIQDKPAAASTTKPAKPIWDKAVEAVGKWFEPREAAEPADIRPRRRSVAPGKKGSGKRVTDSYMKEIVPVDQPIAAGKGLRGEDRIRLGASMPPPKRQTKPEGETQATMVYTPQGPVPIPYVGDDESGYRPPEDLLAHTSAPLLLAGSQVMNDAHTRLANARRWGANDPFDESEPPLEYEVTLPGGEKVRTDRDLTYYLKIGDGQIMSIDDWEQSEPVDFAIIPPTDPRYRDDLQKTPDGQGVLVLSRKLKSTGKVVPETVFQNREVDSRRFPDGTAYWNADGTVSPVVENAPITQIDDPRNLWGPVNPRGPLENTAGDLIWEKDYWRDYDPDKNAIQELADRSTWKEWLPFLADLQLGSAPYYMPLWYSIPAGAARAMPYLYGADSDSYMPEAPGLEQLDTLGLGTYEKRDMERGQLIGGALSSVVEAMVEHALGPKVGGIEKFPGVKGTKLAEFLEGRPVGQFISGTSGEMLEEPATTGLNLIEQHGWGNVGKDYSYNDRDGRYIYSDTDPWARFTNVLGSHMEDAGAGGFAAIGPTLPRIGLAAAAGQYRRPPVNPGMGTPLPATLESPVSGATIRPDFDYDDITKTLER
jgi:hypothetical protein